MTSQQIQFVMWVTGYDRITVLQLWADWIEFK